MAKGQTPLLIVGVAEICLPESRMCCALLIAMELNDIAFLKPGPLLIYPS